MNVYQDSFQRTHTLDELNNDFKILMEKGIVISTAGRVVAKRAMGKITFFEIRDFDNKIQCVMSRDVLGKDAFSCFDKSVKVGDVVGVDGGLFQTNKGQDSIRVKSYTLLSKCKKVLPEKFHGVTDLEMRYRQRYLDLIMNADTRNIFSLRSKVIQAIRSFLYGNNFIEVETPTFQRNPCGASANPFKTHHEASNYNFYLRISPETYLKQLIVGGYDRVFEIGKSYRNEGIDPSHLPEFTMLEFYVAYWSYLDNMVFIEKMIKDMLMSTIGTLKLEYQGEIIDFSGKWPRVDYRDLVLHDCGIDVLKYVDVENLKSEIKRRNINVGEIEKGISLGNLIDKLYKKVSRPKLIQPTFLVHHPASLIPLARLNDEDSRVIDSFQVLVNGWEIVKAYSELADPVLQRSLLEEQVEMRKSGDSEAMFLDEDFLDSLEYGMPPVSGLGLGIDRFVALITNQSSLRDVILFPMMK